MNSQDVCRLTTSPCPFVSFKIKKQINKKHLHITPARANLILILYLDFQLERKIRRMIFPMVRHLRA
ncbi:unnamed protein product [Cuscuta campestris]|uniref:Uncharacterized protein n=1 Tax=Cuscuta campestris TaxID=132261 RepID=A0A484MM20_9ASTE|nr:unnamed protein product [Cuscuta campestris]